MDVVQILTYAFGIVGTAGGLWGYFKKSSGDSTIKYQADSIDALTASLAICKEENAALRSENEVLKQTNQVLKDLAQGSPRLLELTKQIKRLVEVVTVNKR